MDVDWRDLINDLIETVTYSEEKSLLDIFNDSLAVHGFSNKSTQRDNGEWDIYISVPHNFPSYYHLVGKHAENRMKLRQNNISSKPTLMQYLVACAEARNKGEAVRLEQERHRELQQQQGQRSPARGGAARRAQSPGRAPVRAASPSGPGRKVRTSVHASRTTPGANRTSAGRFPETIAHFARES